MLLRLFDLIIRLKQSLYLFACLGGFVGEVEVAQKGNSFCVGALRNHECCVFDKWRRDFYVPRFFRFSSTFLALF